MENKERAFIERLIAEENELNQKIISISSDLNTDNFDQKKGSIQYELLKLQRATMINYQKILFLRIAHLSQSNH